MRLLKVIIKMMVNEMKYIDELHEKVECLMKHIEVLEKLIETLDKTPTINSSTENILKL